MQYRRIGMQVCFIAVLLASGSSYAKEIDSRPSTNAGLPTVDSALKINRVYLPAKYPRVVFSAGGALSFINNSTLENSVDHLLNLYQVSGASAGFGTLSPGLYGAIRLQVSNRYSFWADGVWAPDIKTGKEAKANSHISRLSYFSFGALVTALQFKQRVALSGGAGLTVQRLAVYQTINAGLPDGATLDYVTVSSGQAIGFPVVAMLDTGDPTRSRYGLFFLARYVFSSNVTITKNVYLPSGNVPTTLKMAMSGLRLSAGVSFAL